MFIVLVGMWPSNLPSLLLSAKMDGSHRWPKPSPIVPSTNEDFELPVLLHLLRHCVPSRAIGYKIHQSRCSSSSSLFILLTYQCSPPLVDLDFLSAFSVSSYHALVLSCLFLSTGRKLFPNHLR